MRKIRVATLEETLRYTRSELDRRGMWPAIAGGSPAFVQGNNAYSATTTANNWPCAFLSNVTAGNLLVVAWSWAAVDTTGFSVTDSGGTMTWSYVFSPLASAGSPLNTSAGIAYAQVDSGTGGTTPTVTVHTSGSSHGRIRVCVHEYSGIDTLDVSSSSTGSSATVSSGNMTTAQATELIFGWMLSNNGVTSAGTGFTLRETAGSESTEDEVVTSTGTYAATAPTSSSAWLGLGATFYSSGGGSSPIPLISPVVSQAVNRSLFY